MARLRRLPTGCGGGHLGVPFLLAPEAEARLAKRARKLLGALPRRPRVHNVLAALARAVEDAVAAILEKALQAEPLVALEELPVLRDAASHLVWRQRRRAVGQCALERLARDLAVPDLGGDKRPCAREAQPVPAPEDAHSRLMHTRTR